jgi:hypothetical protein
MAGAAAVHHCATKRRKSTNSTTTTNRTQLADTLNAQLLCVQVVLPKPLCLLCHLRAVRAEHWAAEKVMTSDKLHNCATRQVCSSSSSSRRSSALGVGLGAAYDGQQLTDRLRHNHQAAALSLVNLSRSLLLQNKEVPAT